MVSLDENQMQKIYIYIWLKKSKPVKKGWLYGYEQRNSPYIQGHQTEGNSAAIFVSKVLPVIFVIKVK